MTDPARASRLPLGPDEAHVWYVRSDQVVEPARLAGYQTLLSREEGDRFRRFVFDRDRHEFLIAHALVRTVLSKYADVRPAAWHFGTNGRGRPVVVAPAAHSRLEFNLSHTRGLAACIVARQREVGVDVEHVGREPAVDDLAVRHFSADEVAALQTLPPRQRKDRFLEVWTLKEAYLKARGVGLSIPLGRFSFRLVPGEAPVVSFAPELADDPETWQFAQFRPTAAHVMAVAIRRAPETPVRIRVHETMPLAEP